VLNIIDIAVGIGLLLRRRWFYVCFFVLSAYDVLLAITNMIVTESDTLVRLGWKLSENGLSGFHLVQSLGVCCAVSMAIWLHSYRREFKRDSAERDYTS